MTYAEALAAYEAADSDYCVAYFTFQDIADGFVAGTVANADYEAARAKFNRYLAAVDAAEAILVATDEPAAPVAAVTETQLSLL